jgi:glycosyltransferase involved in cell wall biosynthesis
MVRNLRILLVIPHFYPAEAFGGPVRVALDTGRELVKRGHEVVVFTSDAKDWKHRIALRSAAVEGMEVHYFRNLSMFLVKESNLFLTPDLFRKMRLDLKSFDVVHFHEYTTFQNIVVHHFAKKYGIPYVLQVHGSLPKTDRVARKWIYDVLFGRRILSDASKVIALTQTEAQQYQDVGVPKEKIEIIPNGIDLSEYANLPPKGCFKKKFGIGEDEKIVLYLGRIHQSKGLDMIADAFRIVVKKLENVRLVVVGPNDGYASAFSEAISDLRDKVLLTGFISKDDKMAAFVDGDVFVTPMFSGFPITFLEACLAGCPIITMSKELDWIHNNVGYVVENSPVAFAEAISCILQDEEVQKRFRNNCRYAIKNFDYSILTSHLESTYKSVIR